MDGRTLDVTLEWSEVNQKWLMKIGGHFVYDFWDCKTVNNAFLGPDKGTVNKYKITIEKVNS